MTTSPRRPMMISAGVMAVMAVVSLGGLVFDDRILLGAPIWLKPLKFALSIGIYFLTWGWLSSLLTVRQRLVARISAVVIGLLGVEYAILITQVIRGRASHFNVSTTFDRLLYLIMGGSIAVIWTGTLVLTVLLFRTPIADTASRLAIRWGAVISLIGIGLGGLMLIPTPQQRASAVHQVVGAHSVGVPDGGPVMAVTGWSTTGGDLRIPHFVGMHALQVLPLLVMLLGFLARRFPRLRPDRTRGRLTAIATAAYAGLVALVTWQAERGQPFIHPDGLTLSAFGLLVATTLGAGTLVIARGPAGTTVPEPVRRTEMAR
ncbi:hypothetical protein [Amycolatopsis rhizosphaerae]|uniref:hypothetical protein n=1 Tax=Amycolatopsis rhizosphaerae TaxID=2053003 RepID=UPI001643C69F